MYFYFPLKPLFVTYDSERLSFYLLACSCVVCDSCRNIITEAVHLVFSNCKLGAILAFMGAKSGLFFIYVWVEGRILYFNRSLTPNRSIVELHFLH